MILTSGEQLSIIIIMGYGLHFSSPQDAEAFERAVSNYYFQTKH